MAIDSEQAPRAGMRAFRRAGIAFVLLCVLLSGCSAYLGYLGGDLFVPVEATAISGPRQVAAVIVSGDMGFTTGMGPKIGKKLAADGIPVLGVNSLVYFRTRRSPAEIGALIADAVRRGLDHGRAERLILIGQSFGADMVHVGLIDLPPDLRRRIAMVALIVPGDTVDYRASPSELLNWAKPDAPALPTARQLTWVPTLCVYGREETNSLCPLLSAPNVHKVALPGGHPLRRDADALYAPLRAAIDQVTARQ